MRLTKIKLAGFKSFVDPTHVSFPQQSLRHRRPQRVRQVERHRRRALGHGRAVRASHLRGDSMADVIFNGSSARKPVGAASVELVFDNSDGKIGGAYASYNEVVAEAAWWRATAPPAIS